MTSPPPLVGRGGRRAPEGSSYDRSSFWRSTNSIYNTRPILPLAPSGPVNSSWEMTRPPPPSPFQQPTATSINGSHRTPEYLDQFFSSLKLDEMKESEGIFPPSDQLPPKPQGQGHPSRSRDPTFCPPPTLFQLEAQERMRPLVLGGRSYKDKLGSVAQSWDDAPPTGGFGGEDRILGMFEIPPDPPSRSGSPFRDETWLGPGQGGPYTITRDSGVGSGVDVAPPPSWISNAFPPNTVHSRQPPQVVEPTLAAGTVQDASIIETTQDEAIVVTTLGDEGMEERPRYNRRSMIRTAKAEALKLARAGTSFDRELWHSRDAPRPDAESVSPIKGEAEGPRFSSPISSQAGSEEKVVILADEAAGAREISNEKRHGGIYHGVDQEATTFTAIQHETMVVLGTDEMIPSTPPTLLRPVAIEQPHQPQTDQAGLIGEIILPPPALENTMLVSPIRSSYLSTPQSRLEKMEMLEKFRMQVEAGSAT